MRRLALALSVTVMGALSWTRPSAHALAQGFRPATASGDYDLWAEDYGPNYDNCFNSNASLCANGSYDYYAEVSGSAQRGGAPGPRARATG